MGFEEKERSRVKKKSVVSTISGVGIDEKQEECTHREEEKRKGRPPVNRETKKRISLAVFPSVYEDIGKIAYVDRDTISNLIGKCLEEYIKKNQDKIEEYNRLKK